MLPTSPTARSNKVGIYLHTDEPCACSYVCARAFVWCVAVHYSSNDARYTCYIGLPYLHGFNVALVFAKFSPHISVHVEFGLKNEVEIKLLFNFPNVKLYMRYNQRRATIVQIRILQNCCRGLLKITTQKRFSRGAPTIAMRFPSPPRMGTSPSLHRLLSHTHANNHPDVFITR